MDFSSCKGWTVAVTTWESTYTTNKRSDFHLRPILGIREHEPKHVFGQPTGEISLHPPTLKEAKALSLQFISPEAKDICRIKPERFSSPTFTGRHFPGFCHLLMMSFHPGRDISTLIGCLG